MATNRPQRSAAENEGIGEIVVVMLAICVGLGGVIWLFASARMVWASLNFALFFGAIWSWFPFEVTTSIWNSLVSTAIAFSKNSADVGFFEWVSFVNLALIPTAITLFFVYGVVLVFILMRKRVDLNRRLSPDELLEESLLKFSGIAPVLKIRKKIVDNKLPEWRVQVSPEEVFLGQVGNQSMIASGEFDRDVAREYFLGISKAAPDGRVFSTMLGWQIVNLPKDRNVEKPIVFSDRFSNEGKALLGLFAAVAFGDDEGKEEYEKYKDLLNRSSYGSPLGCANLTVARPLFEKYRKHKDVMQLFSVHHWEHTYLFALLEIAQRRGRYTTAEILWLRPANRQMYVSLNSCGSKVAHVESASTFSQVGFERTCVAINRLPLHRDEVTGELRHSISVERAVLGLEADYLHWKASADDDKDWWKNKNLWKERDQALSRALNESQKVVLPPIAPGEDSDFDKQQKALREKIEAKNIVTGQEELDRLFSVD